ncbi:hypothetical protein E4U43_006205, partial [Claviceps pusilla]
WLPVGRAASESFGGGIRRLHDPSTTPPANVIRRRANMQKKLVLWAFSVAAAARLDDNIPGYLFALRFRAALDEPKVPESQ